MEVARVLFWGGWDDFRKHAMQTELNNFDLKDISPYGYPFVLVDKVVDFKKGKYVKAIKNITSGEWSYQGLGKSCMDFPDSFVLEATAQTAVIFLHLEKGLNVNRSEKFVLGKIQSEFLGQCGIGDQMVMTTGAYKIFENKGYISVDVSVNDVKKADVQIFFSILKV